MEAAAGATQGPLQQPGSATAVVGCLRGPRQQRRAGSKPATASGRGGASGNAAASGAGPPAGRTRLVALLHLLAIHVGARQLAGGVQPAARQQHGARRQALAPQLRKPLLAEGAAVLYLSPLANAGEAEPARAHGGGRLQAAPSGGGAARRPAGQAAAGGTKRQGRSQGPRLWLHELISPRSRPPPSRSSWHTPHTSSVARGLLAAMAASGCGRQRQLPGGSAEHRGSAQGIHGVR